VYVLSIECAAAEAEFLAAELWELGAAGIQEESVPGACTVLRAWFDSPDGLLKKFPAYSPRLEEEEAVDWEAVSRDAWAPFELGERLYLAPDWDHAPTPAGRLRLTIHPGQALGTGAHPATQLCLEALESNLKPGERVLDVGTGSGILIAGARLLGAGAAAGCDVDPDSAGHARANLQSDGCPALVWVGSLRSARAGWADVVVANINAAAHLALAAEYARAASRLVILSGFRESDTRRVQAALAATGFSLVDTLERSEWKCLVFSSAEPS
jgi:ribosomal protein L11 methyltransferase